MTNAEYLIHHLNKLKTWSRFVTSAHTSDIDYLLSTIPTKDTSITRPQYDAFLKLSGAILDRFRQAPEGDIMWEVLNLQSFLSNDDGKTVAALLAAFVAAPLSFEQLDAVTTLLSKARKAKTARDDWALMAEIKRYRNNFYLDHKEVGFLDNWCRDLADPNRGTLTSSQRYYANQTLRRAKQRAYEGKYILPPNGVCYA
jgi:hypothetical protein